MNRIEYIPGDLVNTLFGIAKITNVYKEGSYDFEGKSFSGSDTCEPIPLTPEILEKNGWKVYHRGTRFIFIIDDNSYIIIEWRNNEVFKAFLFRGAKYARLIDLLYVHQLQHLLFGLGLKTEMEV